MKTLLSGDEAIAQAVAEAGVAVASAYPGTPSTEILESILVRSPETDASWAVNEKNAYEVAYGAAIAGMRAITSMKHVGMNVAADPLMTSAYTGINAGLVVVVADDPGMHSSQNEQDSRHYARFSKLPMLEPSDSQEAYDFVKEAFELSEKFDLPVIVRITTRIAHTQTIVTHGERAPLTGGMTFPKDITKYVMVPAFARVRRVTLEARIAEAKKRLEKSRFNRIEKGSPDIGVITSGVDYQYVKEAFPGVSVLKLGCVYPFPDEMIVAFAKSVKQCYVIEALDPFIEEHVRSLGIAVEKRLHSFDGELSVDALKLYTGTTKKHDHAHTENLPPRPPALCKGCSHRAVFETLREMNVTVLGDIGCYTLGAMAPFNAMHACLCMGASVGMTSGFERVKKLTGDTTPVVGVIGDSTFLHTGIAGLLDAVYNASNITLIILDNYVTAMTGHQPNPATGITAKGAHTPRADLATIVQALGVKRVITFDPYKEKNMRALIQEETKRDEVSVIIAEAPCIFYKKRFANVKRNA